MANSFRAHPSSLAAALLFSLLAAPAPAQQPPLVEVAREEQARRASISEKSTVYTNDDLDGGPRLTTGASPPPPPRAGESEQPDEPAGAAAPRGANGAQSPAASAAAGATTAAPAQDETGWRERITAAREAAQRAEIVAAALQNRVDGLLTEFTARDDPAQRARIEQDRRDALSELERAREAIDRRAQEVADIREEARRAGVPPGWLR